MLSNTEVPKLANGTLESTGEFDDAGTRNGNESDSRDEQSGPESRARRQLTPIAEENESVSSE